MNFKQLLKTIEKKEYYFIIVISLLMVFISSLPFILGFVSSSPDQYYNGLHSTNTKDYFVYYSYINQAKEGNWLFTDYYSFENQPVEILNIFWLSLGLFAKIFNLSAIAIFQISRVFLAISLIFILYIFASYIYSDKLKRKIALIFFCFSSGIGAFAVRLWPDYFPLSGREDTYNWPIDLWMGEANIFSAIYHSPHFIMSLLLMVAFFLLILISIKNNKLFYSVFAGLLGLLWFNFHPYYFVPVVTIITIYYLYSLVKTKQLKFIYNYFIILFLSIPFVIYHYYFIKTDFVTGQRALLNATLTPDFIQIIWGFGFLLLFSVIGLYFIAKNKKLNHDPNFIFLAIWFLSILFLIYAPLHFQNRFILGWQIPMVFLTIEGLNNLCRFFKSKFKVNNIKILPQLKYLLFSCIFIIFFSVSIFFNLTRDAYYLFKYEYFYFLQPEFLEASQWLEQNNLSQKIILTDFYSGLILPGIVNQRVYCGHSRETILYKSKEKNIIRYFNNLMAAQEEENFLTSNNIGFLLLTEFTEKIFDFDPRLKPYWQKMYSQGETVVYRYIPSNITQK